MGKPSAIGLLSGALVVLFAAVSFLWPSLLLSLSRPCNQFLDRLAGRRRLSCWICFALPVLLRLAILPLVPSPVPVYHDEFSVLLQADTFAHGRVTNPPLPLGSPLEQIYVLSRPTRQSVYPPAKGLLLAFGQVVFGSPWAGIVLGMGAVCGLLCWSLQGWVTPRWAFRAGLFATLTLSLLNYWMNSYWGDLPAIVSGLLMWGATGRLLRAPTAARAVLFAAGVVLGMNSRPIETVPFALVLALPLVRTAGIWKVAVPAAACLLAGAAATCWYDWRVTGNPLIPPHLAERSSAGTPQSFYFERPVPPPPRFPFDDFRAEYAQQLRFWNQGQTLRTFLGAAGVKIYRFRAHFLPAPMLLALLGFPFAVRSRSLRLALAAALVLGAHHLFYGYYFPHYDSCLAGVIGLILLRCWRHLRLWRPAHRPFGNAFCVTLPWIPALGIVVQLASSSPVWRPDLPQLPARPALLQSLEQTPGLHLAFVHYTPLHDPDEDWIHNFATPSEARLVLARHTTDDEDARFAQSFPGRRRWYIEADSNPPTIRELP